MIYHHHHHHHHRITCAHHSSAKALQQQFLLQAFDRLASDAIHLTSSQPTTAFVNGGRATSLYILHTK